MYSTQMDTTLECVRSITSVTSHINATLQYQRGSSTVQWILINMLQFVVEKYGGLMDQLDINY